MWIVPSAAMLLAAGLWGAGCGGDDAPATPGAGGSAGAGGGGGGGTTDGGKGGSAGKGGSEAGKPDLPNEYSITTCTGVTETAVPTTLASCNTLCGGGHCVPASNGDPNGTFKTCPGGTDICLPDKVIASGGKFVGKACMVSPLGGTPGMCLPSCILPATADVLMAGGDGCAMSEKCVPCDYMDASTGACTNRCVGGSDAGEAGPGEGGSEAGDAAGDTTTSDVVTTDATTDVATDVVAQ
jgi:hypothetical protein